MSGLLLLAACALAPQRAADAPGNRLVKVDLLADRASIRAGESFSLGVRLRIEPAWHIYWENHGDSGFPTRARISGPDGFTIGEPRYPGPELDVAEGDIESYVYHGEVVLLVDVKAPDELPERDLRAVSFGVEASWLVCTDVCHPGSGEARIEIPVAIPIAAGRTPGAPANEKLFADARARLPRAWSDLAGASIEWRGSEDVPIAVVTVQGATGLELFPLASETTDLEERTTERAGAACRLTATLRFRKSAPQDAPRLAGVLRVRKEQGESFYRLDSTPERPASQGRSH